MSQITTHILDTSLGKPAADVEIKLQASGPNGWETIGSGKTNSDGRVSNLLDKDKILPPGTYRMVFETQPYFKRLNVTSFYPVVIIDFLVRDNCHYHVPLLLNPFGFSTYRGS